MLIAQPNTSLKVLITELKSKSIGDDSNSVLYTYMLYACTILPGNLGGAENFYET